jgi:hypothetical protein
VKQLKMGNAINNKSYKTNDGQHIPSLEKSPRDMGDLEITSSYRNDVAFNDSVMSDKSMNGGMVGMNSWQQSVNLDDPGFDASGSQIYKQGTPYGEGAMFNQLPPGHDISDQALLAAYAMPLKMITDMGYPGDGAFPVRDVPE